MAEMEKLQTAFLEGCRWREVPAQVAEEAFRRALGLCRLWILQCPRRAIRHPRLPNRLSQGPPRGGVPGRRCSRTSPWALPTARDRTGGEALRGRGPPGGHQPQPGAVRGGGRRHRMGLAQVLGVSGAAGSPFSPSAGVVLSPCCATCAPAPDAQAHAGKPDPARRRCDAFGSRRGLLWELQRDLCHRRRRTPRARSTRTDSRRCLPLTEGAKAERSCRRDLTRVPNPQSATRNPQSPSPAPFAR